MVEKLKSDLDGKKPLRMTADSGYFSEDNVSYLAQEQIDGYVAVHDAVPTIDRIMKCPQFAPVWDALAAFVRTAQRTLVIVLGNHDIELAFPNVQRRIIRRLAGDDLAAQARIEFSTMGAGFSCEVGGSRGFCTHGNEVYAWNYVRYEDLSKAARRIATGRPLPPSEWEPNAGAKMVKDVMKTLGAYVAVGVQALLVGSAFGAPMIGMAVATLAAIIACAIVSVAAYELIFRRLGRAVMVASLLASIGLAFLIRSLITLLVGHEQHTFALPLVRAWNFGGLRILPSDLVIGAVAALVLPAVFAWLRFGRSGRLLRAVADNPDLARLSGIRAQRLMWLLWALAGALSAIGGVLLGVESVVMPELGWELLLPAFGAMILGGIGSAATRFTPALIT